MKGTLNGTENTKPSKERSDSPKLYKSDWQKGEIF